MLNDSSGLRIITDGGFRYACGKTGANHDANMDAGFFLVFDVMVILDMIWNAVMSSN